MPSSVSVKIIIILGIIALASWLWYKFWSHFKVPNTGCITLVSGGVKSGKSTLSVYMAYVNYKRALRSWRFRVFFQRLLHKTEDEKPLLYSNVPLAIPYVPLTKELLERKTRFRFHSVIYVNEASLVVDNQVYRDMELSERIRLWCKLIGHELHGGYGRLILDTQSIGDCAIEVRRNLSEYLYIHHLIKAIPFFLIAKVREERYSEDGTAINAYTEDVEEKLKMVLMTKRIWKKFDAYCFSYFTDDLDVEDREVKVIGNDLKAKEIVSFRDYTTIKVKEDPKRGDKSSSRWSKVFSKGVDDSGEVRLSSSCDVSDERGRGEIDGTSSTGGEIKE